MSAAPSPRRILVCADFFEPGFRAGGPIRSLVRMLENAPEDAHVTLVTRDRDDQTDVPFPGLSGRWTRRGRHDVFYLNTRSPTQWLALLRKVRAESFEMVYVNSFWSPLFGLLPVIAARSRAIRTEVVLVAPRGEVARGARSLKARKKKLALIFWRPWFRHRRVLWHATSEAEVQDVLALFPEADVRLIPGEPSVPDKAAAPPPPDSRPLRLVFISRIAPKKNLAAALEALTRVHGEVGLDIYGPISDRAYWARCQQLIRSLPDDVSVVYHGELSPSEVPGTFHRYDAFCLPTLGENFGHVIAESLAAACPVICTDSTPWTPVLQDGGGSILRSPAVEDVAGVIQEWMDLTPADRYARRRSAARAFDRWRAAREDATVLDAIRASSAVRANGERRRIALVTQGFDTGGGVPAVARWIRDGLVRSGGYDVDIHDVAVSRSDPASRRLLSPRSWFSGSLKATTQRAEATHWGANAVELEPMRYRPRRELTQVLNQYDLVQVVSGGPALGRITEKVRAPRVLESATCVAWERASQLARTPGAVRHWRRAMTHLVTRDERRAVAAADAVVVANRQLAQKLLVHTRAPVIVAPHGMDTHRFHPGPDGRRQDGYLLSVSRLGDPRKGLDRLVTVYAQLLERDPTAPELVLAGKGSLLEAARLAIARHGLGTHVTILPDVPPADLPDLYRGASVFVQASHEEGFGLSVAEAMASALPVVCTDTFGARETVVPGETGWLIPQVPEFNATDMVTAIESALGPEGKTRGLAGLARCRALFSQDTAIDRITALYDRLLQVPTAAEH